MSCHPPAGDPARAEAARVYDALAGGLDNYPADRAEAARLLALYPGIRQMVARNRQYLGHAVLFAATRLGVRQFLDLGSGFPSAGSVRDLAQAHDPDARVACVDWDPLAGDYGALLEAGGVKGVSVVQADIRDPGAVLAHPGVLEVISPGEPAALVFGMVLQAMGLQEAREVTAGYASAVPAGSCVVITVPRCDDEDLFTRGTAGYPCEPSNFSPAEVRSLFGGLEVQPPGVGPVAGARPGWGQPGRAPGRVCVLGGIGVKLSRLPAPRAPGRLC